MNDEQKRLINLSLAQYGAILTESGVIWSTEYNLSSNVRFEVRNGKLRVVNRLTNELLWSGDLTSSNVEVQVETKVSWAMEMKDERNRSTDCCQT